MLTLDMIRIKLQEAIKQSNMTQSELAQKIGVKRPQISAYRHGTKMPALDTFAKLCAVLDIDANDILCISEYKNEQE